MKHDFREKSEKKEAITAKKLARFNEKEEDLKEKETTRKLSHVETSPEEIVDLRDWGEQHKCWRKQKVNKKGGPKRWKRSKRLWMTIVVPTYKWVQKGVIFTGIFGRATDNFKKSKDVLKQAVAMKYHNS